MGRTYKRTGIFSARPGMAKSSVLETLERSCQISAIHVQGGSGNEACLWTGNESDHRGDLIGVPQPFERYETLDCARMRTIRRVHIGFGRSGLNRVHGDSPGARSMAKPLAKTATAALVIE